MANYQIWQQLCLLPAYTRGFHIITPQIVKHLHEAPYLKVGLFNLFLQHTSASLCISENSCTDVRQDLEQHFNRLIPDDERLYTHNFEGPDDMPAHIKNALLGCSLNIPVQDGKLLLGQWQAIFLCEHRNQAPTRKIILTLQGLE